MVLRTIGPRITGPGDLGCLGSKVRGPKVRGSKALGLIILEPTLADADTNSMLADDANKAIWGSWLSFRWCQCGLGDHQGGRQVGGTGVARNIGAGVLLSCDHVGDNICCWTIRR